MLRTALRALCRRAARHLPITAQAGLLEGLTLDPWFAAQITARKAGVRTFGVSGEIGEILGPVSDDIVLRTYARQRHFAERTIALLRSFFAARGGTYLDIGANLGLTTIPIAKLGVRCIAIEPDPTNFSHLAVNVAANCPSGSVTLRQCAIFSERTTLLFEQSPGNAGDHRLRVKEPQGQMGEAEWATTRVEAVPLDDLLNDVSVPLAVKVDVQGAEPYVFGGGRKVLENADLVVLEWQPYLLKRLGGDPEIVTSFLSSQFHALRIAEREDGPLSDPIPAREAAEQLLAMYRTCDDPHPYVDVIAQRETRA